MSASLHDAGVVGEAGGTVTGLGADDPASEAMVVAAGPELHPVLRAELERLVRGRSRTQAPS